MFLWQPGRASSPSIASLILTALALATVLAAGGAECRAAGRDDRNLQFTSHAMTPKQREGSTPCP